jgi:arylsulfatase A-like enzyme
MRLPITLTAALLLAPLAALQAAAPSKPNIVVILADDLGYGDLGCYGAKFKTPVIDQLAADGVRFTDLILPANVCSPSRAALLTGRYPMRNGHPFVFNEGVKCGLHPDELTIPELLKTAGYRSLAVGKWHLGLEFEGAHPLDAGFDEFLGLKANYPQARGDGAEGGAKGNTSTLYRGKKIEAERTDFETLTTRYTDEVVSFIERQKDAPFFIYMAHHIPHTPVRPSSAFKGTTGAGALGDFVSELDHSVGRVLKALKETGRDQNTLVVFLSDNGPEVGQGSAGPLLGRKYVTTEGGHRVPGIFRWSGQIPARQVSDTTISSMDLLPLFCDMAGVPLPTDRKIDGANILAVLTGKSKKSPHEFLYYYNGSNLQAVRQGKWKLHLPRTTADQPFWAKVGNPTVKPMLVLKENVLFDLEADIGEKSDVAAQNPAVVALLLKEAERIRGELGDVRIVGTDQRPTWPPAKVN